MKRLAIAFVIAAVGLSCTTAQQTSKEFNASMDTLARRYVKLVLALGEHDENYVDAYYGPDILKTEAAAEKWSVEDIRREATDVIAQLQSHQPPAGVDELTRLRHSYLLHQMQSLVARADMLLGKKLTFDEESKALYDAVAPQHPRSEYDAALADLDRILPGDGALSDRLTAYRKQFIIPYDRLDRVFQRAIQECRARTLAHVKMPEGESFTVEYVKNKPWAGYNWYKGNFTSLIQVNTELPIYIDRAIDLACHEGYPGHHVYNALLEKNLVRDRGWVEFTVYPLFSPQSLVAEGSANYGIEVAFPGQERMEFEKNVLFPLAGLDATAADRYYAINKLMDRLSYASNDAARMYLDGELDAAATQEMLAKYSLMSPERAKQRIRFVDTYRSYVINYNLGKDLVQHFVESHGGTADHPEQRWKIFSELLESPRLPEDLK